MTIAYIRNQLLKNTGNKDINLILVKKNIKLSNRILTEYTVSALEKFVDHEPILMADFFYS